MSAPCPWCGEAFKPVAEMVFRNVETYGTPAVSIAKCCGKAVTVSRVVSYRLSPSNQSPDDWGNPETKAGDIRNSLISGTRFQTLREWQEKQ